MTIYLLQLTAHRLIYPLFYSRPIRNNNLVNFGITILIGYNYSLISLGNISLKGIAQFEGEITQTKKSILQVRKENYTIKQVTKNYKQIQNKLNVIVKPLFAVVVPKNRNGKKSEYLFYYY
jgi:hypothetical protein